MATKVISDLKSVSRLTILPETGPWPLSQFTIGQIEKKTKKTTTTKKKTIKSIGDFKQGREIVAKIISELKFVSRLKMFSETGPRCHLLPIMHANYV